MLSLHTPRIRNLILVSIAFMLGVCPLCRSQAALLMEQPYGLFGQLNPTGHNAVYLARVCAETPVLLRPCRPGEDGVVIARYQGIDGYDWVAIPLIPYLYSVNEISEVPERVDRATVERLRDNYRETGLASLGNNVSNGNFAHGGWTELVGSAYERRIYAFWFQTTPAQDDALIEKLNAAPNQTKFSLLFFQLCRLCARHPRQLLPGQIQAQHLPRCRHDYPQADRLQAGALRPQASRGAYDGL